MLSPGIFADHVVILGQIINVVVRQEKTKKATTDHVTTSLGRTKQQPNTAFCRRGKKKASVRTAGSLAPSSARTRTTRAGNTPHTPTPTPNAHRALSLWRTVLRVYPWAIGIHVVMRAHAPFLNRHTAERGSPYSIWSSYDRVHQGGLSKATVWCAIESKTIALLGEAALFMLFIFHK